MNHMRNTAVLLGGFLLCAAQGWAEGGEFKNYELGQWKLDFGLEDRVRVEQKKDFDLNDNVYDNGALVYQRFRLNGRAALEKKYEVFAEGLDARVYSAHVKPTAQTNAFDLYQAYARVNGISGSPVDLKAGRQELQYGKGRLIATTAWANRTNRYDAMVAHYKANGLYADMFYGSRVRVFDRSFDEWNKHDMLDGVYMGYQKEKTSPLFETYFIRNYNADNFHALQRNTVGVRAQATAPGDIVCDMEIPYQFGKTADSHISAYAFHFDASRSFDAAWKPALTAKYNLSTGDRKAGNKMSNTFVPLFQTAHGSYGVMDLFRWQNMREAALEAALTPYRKWKLIPATNFFWLDSYRDSWYDSSGTKLRTMPAKGKARYYVGQELSLLAKYDLSDALKLDAGYAHFFTGEYIKDTGASDDADWFYFQANLKI